MVVDFHYIPLTIPTYENIVFFLWEALIKVKEGVEGYARLEAS